MTDAPAPEPGAQGAVDPPRERDYVRGIVMSVGLLVLLVVAIWLLLTVLGVDLCGCGTRPAATP